MAEKTPTDKRSYKYEPEKVLLAWSSPGRVFKKRDRRFFSTIAVIILAVSIISILSGQYALIAVILSLFFLTYALSAIEPDIVEHKITNKGVSYCNGKLYEYNKLKDFFFTQKDEKTVLNVGTKKYYPGRLYLIIEKKDVEKVKDFLLNYLPYIEEPPVTVFDKFSSLASKYLSLE